MFLDLDMAFFNLINLMHIASLIVFIHHVLSAIIGFKVKIKYIFLLPLLLYIIPILANYFGYYFIDFQTSQTYFLNVLVLDFRNMSDKVFFKALAIIPLIIYLLLKTKSSIYKSYTIKRKKLYAIWIYSYCFLFTVTIFFTNLYYFGVFEDHLTEILNLAVRINAFFIIVFFMCNPVVLFYLPIIKSISIYSYVGRKNYFNLIESYFKKEENYLIPKLGINDLSSLIGVSVTNIRASIMLYSGVNYNVYINNLRIANALLLINSGYLENHTLVSLAEKCGFNSHQSFFRAFKRIHTMSPGEYVKLSFPLITLDHGKKTIHPI